MELRTLEAEHSGEHRVRDQRAQREQLGARERGGRLEQQRRRLGPVANGQVVERAVHLQPITALPVATLLEQPAPSQQARPNQNPEHNSDY